MNESLRYCRLANTTNLIFGVDFPSPSISNRIKPLWRKVWYFFGSFFWEFLIDGLTFCVIVNVALADTRRKILLISPMVHVAQAGIRCLVIHFTRNRQRIYVELLNDLLQDVHKNHNKEYGIDLDQLWNQVYKQQRIIGKILLGINLTLASAYCSVYLYKLFVDIKSIRFNILHWMPYDTHYNEAVTVMTTLALLIAVSGVDLKTQGINNMIVVMLTMQTFMFRYLKLRQSIIDPSDVREMRLWFKHYSMTIKLCQPLRQMISPVITITYFEVLLNVAFSVLTILTKNAPNNMSQKASTFTAVLIVFFALYILCYVADKIDQEHETLAEGFYNPNMLMDRKAALPMLVFFNTNSLKIQFTASDLFTLSNATFTVLLNTVISFVLTVKQLEALT